jgi:hypothetical protein
VIARAVSLLLIAWLLPAALLAQHDAAPRFSVEGYAVANYYRFDWQTDPRRRNTIDLERLAVEPSYLVNDWLRFDAEIEFEHGGTGVTVEFDPFEEFGEFETDVEKGGEIDIEKLEAVFTLRRGFNVRVGRLYVPVGLISSHDEPDEYFTNTRNETEVALIPSLWHETGVGVFGTFGRARYQALLVSGLDATGFSSANWIVGGWQKRFEQANANGLAVVGRLDFDLDADSYVGMAGYLGNSAANRPKADLAVPANVGIVEAHAVIERGPFKARGLLLYGRLQNSGVVSAANRNLSNNLNVKRTPVASAALGWFVEAGYDVLPLLTGDPARPGGQGLDLFARYDDYDSMHRVVEGVFDNPRWERHVLTAGLNWRVHPTFLVKGEYAHRTLGLPTANREDIIALGFGLIYGQ